MDIKKIDYRQISRIFTQALPIDDSERLEVTNSYIRQIKALPVEAKIALRSAYIFSAKVPREEREDLFQDIALTLLKARLGDEKLAYAIARCDWIDFWKSYKHRQHYSLDAQWESHLANEEGSPLTLAEVIVGEAEFEAKMDGKIEDNRIWGSLPDNIKPLIAKRLLGQTIITRYKSEPKPKNWRKLDRWSKRMVKHCQRQVGRPKSEANLTDCERQRLNRWVKAEGYKLLIEA